MNPSTGKKDNLFTFGRRIPKKMKSKSRRNLYPLHWKIIVAKDQYSGSVRQAIGSTNST